MFLYPPATTTTTIGPTMNRTTTILVLAYLAAITAANLIATNVGPQATIYTALGLVALDLVLRDALHDRVNGRQRIALMALLVLGGAAIAYAINADAARIARASAAAFAAALTVDTIVYHAARRLPWVERSNVSNIASSIVDSAVFVTLAFPGFLWSVAVGQATAKIAGGLIFAMLIERVLRVGVYDLARHNHATLTHATRRR